MDILVPTIAFNPTLIRKVVVIKGLNNEGEDVSGVYFVTKVESDVLTLTPPTGNTVRLHQEDTTGEEPVLIKVIDVEGVF